MIPQNEYNGSTERGILIVSSALCKSQYSGYANIESHTKSSYSGRNNHPTIRSNITQHHYTINKLSRSLTMQSDPGG